MQQLANPENKCVNLIKQRQGRIKATQKALKAVDSYERRQNTIPASYLALPELERHHTYVKEIHLRENHKMQVLPYETQFYRLEVNEREVGLKLVLKKLNGQEFGLSIGFDKKQPTIKQNDFYYHIKSQIIIPIKRAFRKNVNFIHFGIQGNADFLMFTMRVDQLKRDRLKTQQFISQDKMVNSTDSITNQFRSTSLIPIHGRVDNYNKSQMNKAKSVQKFPASLKLNLSDKKLRLSSPVQTKQLLQHKRQLEKQKAASAREKKKNLQTARQKERELFEIASKCKRLMVIYEKQHHQKMAIQIIINKDIAQLIYAAKVLAVFHSLAQEREKMTQNASKLNKLIKRFSKNIRKSYRQTKAMVPSSKHRELVCVQFLTCFLAKAVSQNGSKKASTVIFDVIGKLRPALLINQGLEAATEYRRQVRTIQRYWIGKFKARTDIIEHYGNNQVIKLMKDYPKFRPLKPLYNETQICRKLCYEYQSTEADRIHTYFKLHDSKLKEIEQFKRMNQQINNSNSTALKKYQKAYLDVPLKPPRPQTRFFRNLDIFKSMLRGWLEVECRKHAKRQQAKEEDYRKHKKSHKKSLPKNISPSKPLTRRSIKRGQIEE